MVPLEPSCSNPNSTLGQNLTRQQLWSLLMNEEEQEGPLKAPTFILLGILMAVGLAGNVMVLLVYWFRFPASTTKCFILGMASYDLLNCLAGMPFEMYDLRYDLNLDIPEVCKIMRFLVTISACGSILILIAVSVDRFRRICQPFRKQMTVKQSKIIIGILALISAIFSFPALILYGRQTEYRYGIALYECTIDDQFVKSAFSRAYQIILGGTFIICIIILVFMYSFIIYKIQQQRKRREKLSSQSVGSAVLTRFKISKDEMAPNLNQKSGSQSGHEDVPTPMVSVIKSKNSYQAHEINNEAQGGNTLDCGTRNSSIKRLFSRDVNPIFEEGEEEVCSENTFDSVDANDIISLTENTGRSRSTAYRISTNSHYDMSEDLNETKKSGNYTQRQSSLNNYLAGSQDTNFTLKSDASIHDYLTVPQDVTFTSKSDVSRNLSSLNNYLANSQDTDVTFGAEGSTRHQMSFDSCSAFSQETAFTIKSEASRKPSSLNNYLAASQDTEVTVNSPCTGETPNRNESTPSRKRKIGLSLGRYRPFDSEEFVRQISTVSSPLEREWTSNSYPLLDDAALTNANFHKRRTSSLPDLQSQTNIRSSKDKKDIKGRRRQMVTNSYVCEVLKAKDRVGSNDSFSSNQSEPEETSVDGNPKANHMNVTWNSADNVTVGSTGLKVVGPQPRLLSVTDDSSSALKSRSPSTATTVTQLGKKKTATREIRTSKVSFMMLLVTAAFVISYLPHLGIQLFKVFGASKVKRLLCTSDSFFGIYHLLMRSFFINNAINPVIYSFYNKTFRQRCLLVLKSPKSLFLRPGHAPGSAPSYSQDCDGSVQS